MTAEAPPEGVELAASSDAVGDAGSGMSVAVVGAGAVGATCAFDLARRGADVTVYERGSIASGSSGRAAGVCYGAFADELDAELGRESIERFRRLSGDDTFPFVECPYVWLAREDDARAEVITSDVTWMQKRGVVAVEMDGTSLGERFPALETDDVAAAGVAGAAGYTDPTQYTTCLAAAAEGTGATLRPETPVSVSIDPPSVTTGESDEPIEYDAVVVAAGAHTKAVLAEAGVDVAMKPYRVKALIASASYEEPMCYDATADFYVRPHPDGLLAGNGTELTEADPDDWERSASSEFADSLLTRVRHRFPDIDPKLERAWAGLCTATPDRNPLIGSIADGIYVATGFQGHGFMRAPAIGDRLARMVVTDESIDAFDPTRFVGDESFEVTAGMTIDADR